MVNKRFDRRRFLVLAGGGTAATVFAASRQGTSDRAVAGTASNIGTVDAYQAYDPAPFTLGVASGDPDDSSVVLWTRLAPDPDNGGGMPAEPVDVTWELAADEAFTDIIDSGTTTAEPDYVHSVHVLVEGLAADTWYWYRFTYDGTVSRIGRTRTLPAPDATPDTLRFGFVSCQAGQANPYPAYRDLAEHDLDLVVHLGDYIYEGTPGDLASFRAWHTGYKSAAMLREAHARFPFVLTWDDHEVQNNYAADVPGNDGDGRPFLERRANAYQAYYEHLPLRMDPPNGPDLLLYKRFAYGNLAEFSVLDTRQYRSDQACGDGINPPCDDLDDPSRTMTGPEQETWLLDGLRQSTARWNVIAQQTIMAKFDYTVGAGETYNLDQWDGYPAARDRILNAIATDRPANPVVISGDWHSAWVNDLLADFSDPNSEILATEFVGTSISSGAEGWDSAVKQGLPENPHVKFYEGIYRGWTLCEVTAERWVSTLRIVLDPSDPNSSAHSLAVYEVLDGQPGAYRLDDGDGVVGTVTSADGPPLTNVELRIANDTTAIVTATNAEGNYHTFVPAGTYAVTANAAGFEPASTEVTVEDGESARADFALDASGAFAATGRVVPGPLAQATTDDIVVGNELIAMAIAVTTQDPQLPKATKGKPLDLAGFGHLDQLDWMNLPYVAAAKPSGTEGWQQGMVSASTVDIVTNGPTQAEVRTVGTSADAPNLEVSTTFTVRIGDPWIVATSVFTNNDAAALTVWIGDVIDHDGTGQAAGVAGHDVIRTPYEQPAEYAPTGRWIGMAGGDGQTYGIINQDSAFVAYGTGNWMSSQREVTVEPGASLTWTRRIAAVDSGEGDDPFAVLNDL